MRGGEDRDVFYYASAADSTTAARDTILGFEVGLDHIDLVDVYDKGTTPDNDALRFIGVAATFSAAGQIRLEKAGKDTIVHVNTNANQSSEMTILLKDIDPTTVTAIDFYL